MHDAHRKQWHIWTIYRLHVFHGDFKCVYIHLVVFIVFKYLINIICEIEWFFSFGKCKDGIN